MGGMNNVVAVREALYMQGLWAQGDVQRILNRKQKVIDETAVA